MDLMAEKCHAFAKERGRSMGQRLPERVMGWHALIYAPPPHTSYCCSQALHYKELEFQTSPHTAVEALIHINNQLRQPEAAVATAAAAVAEAASGLAPHQRFHIQSRRWSPRRCWRLTTSTQRGSSLIRCRCGSRRSNHHSCGCVRDGDGGSPFGLLSRRLRRCLKRLFGLSQP